MFEIVIRDTAFRLALPALLLGRSQTRLSSLYGATSFPPPVKKSNSIIQILTLINKSEPYIDGSY